MWYAVKIPKRKPLRERGFSFSELVGDRFKADAEDTVLGLFLGGIEFAEDGEQLGFGHRGVGQDANVKILEEVGERGVTEQTDDLGLELILLGFGELNGVVESDLLALLVVEAQLNALGASFDVVKVGGLEVHIMCCHGMIIAENQVGRKVV